jgi:uracil-DNA glycosylase family 4
VAQAEALAESAGPLPELQAALAGFEACELRHGARNLVFSDGNPEARVMIVGEAPGTGRGHPGQALRGRAGQLLDAMLSAIGLSRTAEDDASSVYITNMLPWRPPQNRDPTPEEISMLQPFVRRHVELAAPEVLILMGNWACFGLLGKRGITRMRGNWEEALGRPALPMFHPAYLLQEPGGQAGGLGGPPVAQGETWGDHEPHRRKPPFHPVRIAVLAVSDTRSLSEDTSGAVLVERLTEAGHTLAARHIFPMSVTRSPISCAPGSPIPEIDVILTTGAPA